MTISCPKGVQNKEVPLYIHVPIEGQPFMYTFVHVFAFIACTCTCVFRNIVVDDEGTDRGAER